MNILDFSYRLYIPTTRKAFIKEILKQFPSVQEEQIKSIINVKESEIVLSKVETHDATHLVVYFIDKIPYFFKVEKSTEFIPTVYFLWKFPSILPKFYTHKQVFTKLLNGAGSLIYDRTYFHQFVRFSSTCFYVRLFYGILCIKLQQKNILRISPSSCNSLGSKMQGRSSSQIFGGAKNKNR